MFEKVSYIRLWTVVNEKLTIDDKQIARHNLSNPCLQKTWFYVILNDESQVNFKATFEFNGSRFR